MSFFLCLCFQLNNFHPSVVNISFFEENFFIIQLYKSFYLEVRVSKGIEPNENEVKEVLKSKLFQ